MENELKDIIAAIQADRKIEEKPSPPRGEKSDVEAKHAYAELLHRSGNYDSVEITSAPADITAERDGQKYYFELKVTAKSDDYFGAATLTEWEAALKHPSNFKFVIASKKKEEWDFHEYAPHQFMEFSYIPPFKIYFNVPLASPVASIPRQKSRSVKLTSARIDEMSTLYKKFKAGAGA
jgi:hypothetical protein